MAVTIALSGCGTYLSEDGPGRSAVIDGAATRTAPATQPTPYALVTVDDSTLPALEAPPPAPRLSWSTHHTGQEGAIGVGDDLGISIYEAAAGGLFITDHPESPSGNSVTLPTQQVDRNGTITIPWGGTFSVVGMTPIAVQHAIERRLSGSALSPQAIVTILNRRSGMINVLGDVGVAARFSLDPGGEDLLGAIARAGGPRFPSYETIVSVQRNGEIQQTRLSDVARDPDQNIALQPGDTIYLSHRPDYYLALGATGQTTSLGPIDRRLTFGSEHISLADALAQAGGLEDDRANSHAVFLYRQSEEQGVVRPIVYLVDLRDPHGFFYAGRFMMRPEDVIFVSNAPSTDLAKFLSIVVPPASAAALFNNGIH
jgi:polysaccharide export outer membrane protein